jgi:hypothetical protein
MGLAGDIYIAGIALAFGSTTLDTVQNMAKEHDDA